METSVRPGTKAMMGRHWTAAVIVALAGCAVPALAQNENEAPAAKEPAKAAPADVAHAAPKESAKKDNILDGPPTKLAFKGVSVDQIVPFIVEATGKVVLPQNDILSRKNITVMSDGEVPREVALNMLYLALQQNQIAVIVHPDRIVLRDIGELTRGDVPVVGPDESVAERRDLGVMIEKVFTLKFVTSKKFGDAIKGGLPDYAKLTVDEESNRIAVLGSVSLTQRIESLVQAIDRPRAGAVQTQTFRLKHAEASSVAQNINDLFSPAQQGGNNQNQYQQYYGRRGGNDDNNGASVAEIRVATNTQQNSVTVSADPAVLKDIQELIEKEWDQPLDPKSVINKVFLLKNSDPVKVKTALETMFGKASTATTNTNTNRQQGGQNNQNNQNQPASGQGAGRLAGQFTFEAFPDSNRLIVIARSQDNLNVVESIIEELDQPQTIGLPEVIDLKHANAEDLSEQLNVLLAQDGTLATLRRSESGLSTAGTSGASPFATNATTTTGSDGSTTDSSTTSAGNITYWWQRATRATADTRLASNLVGKIRIVPVWRQNAVMVIAPPEYRNSVATLIASLDKPGRQVLLSAIVAEISSDDSLQLGLRWGSGTLSTTNPDNSISVGNAATGTANGWAESIFNTSVLNTTVNINALLSALAQKTAVSILSEPKLFTSDNQEAEFFDGQDIPFITNTQTNTQGNGVIQSFDYRAVGIQLRIRPRITPKREVDLRVNMELSSIVPGQTLFGGFIVDRRETTTQLIIGDRQTIVVSGILRSEDSSIVRKIPLLGDIPLLGELFKSRDKTKTTTELLIFITPMVIENPDEADEVNKPFRQELERQRGIMKEKVEETDLQHKLLVPVDGEPKPVEVERTSGQ